MKIIADLHTHTLVSEHAYSTVDEMLNAAKDKGFLALAITDHGPASSDGAKSVHFKAMHSLPEYINGVRLLKGAEVNIIDYSGKLDLSSNILVNLDFVVASYHEERGKARLFSIFSAIDKSSRFAVKYTEDSAQNSAIFGYYKARQNPFSTTCASLVKWI